MENPKDRVSSDAANVCLVVRKSVLGHMQPGYVQTSISFFADCS